MCSGKYKVSIKTAAVISSSLICKQAIFFNVLINLKHIRFLNIVWFYSVNTPFFSTCFIHLFFQ